MLPSERKLVQEAINRINKIDKFKIDSPGRAELMMVLDEEFGAENVRWALRFLEALRYAQGARGPLGGSDPMWDRELDG